MPKPQSAAQPASFSDKPDDTTAVPLGCGPDERLTGRLIQFEGVTYQLDALPEHPDHDMKLSAWPSGTASYRMDPVPSTGSEGRLVLKLPDLTHCSTFEGVKGHVARANARIEAELVTIGRLSQVKNAPVPTLRNSVWLRLRWDDTDSQEVAVRCIIKEFIPGTTLRDWCNSRTGNPQKAEFPGLKDVREWFDLCLRLCYRLEVIHRERIIHGYLSPDTIVVQELPAKGTDDQKPSNSPKSLPGSKDLFFINTEETTIPPHAEESKSPHRRFYDAPEKWASFTNHEPVDVRAAGEWYAPADIFSLGLTFLFLAIGDPDGKDIGPFDKSEPTKADPGWFLIGNYGKLRGSATIRANVLEALKERQKQVPFALDGGEVTDEVGRQEMAIRISTVVMNCIEPAVPSRAQSLRVVTRLLRLFAPPRDPANAENTVGELLQDAIPRLKELWTQRELHCIREADARYVTINGLPRPISAIVINRLRMFLTDCEDVGLLGQEFTTLRIAGGRFTLLETMLSVFSCLREGDKCQALLTPTFWFKENMGAFGRVLRMLQLSILAGAQVEWLTVLNRRRLSDRPVESVLKSQADLSQELPRGMRETDPLCYATADDESYNSLLRDKLTHIRFEFADMKDYLVLAPDYGGDGGQKLTTLRFWRWPKGSQKSGQNRQESLDAEFEKYWAIRRPLKNYIR